MAQVVGQLLFFLLPFLAMLLGVSDSSEVDFRSLGLVAIICAVALPLATVLLILRVPSRRVDQPVLAATGSTARYRLKEVWDAVRFNPPLLRLLAAFLPVNLLTGMSTGLAYLYLDIYLGLSAELPAILATALLSSIVGIPIWTALSKRYERHRVWAIALILGGIACGAFALIGPGAAALPASFILFPVITLVVSGSVVVYTMSADIVDYGRVHTGQDHGGLYASMFAFFQKSLIGVATALGLGLTGAFGFDATAAEQTSTAVIGIKIGFAIAPALGLLGAAAIIWNYPLDKRRIAEIQAILAERDAAPVSGSVTP